MFNWYRLYITKHIRVYGLRHTEHSSKNVNNVNIVFVFSYEIMFSTFFFSLDIKVLTIASELENMFLAILIWLISTNWCRNYIYCKVKKDDKLNDIICIILDPFQRCSPGGTIIDSFLLLSSQVQWFYQSIISSMNS